MKAIGIVRKIDELGRIVLPVEIRRTMDIKSHDAIEMFVSEDKIVLKKYAPACIFCNNADNVTNYCGKLICRDCLDNLKHSVQ